MSYSINSDEDHQCVFVSYEGEMPPVEFSAARYEAYGVLDQRGWNRLVVDATQLRSVPRAAELFDLAQALSSSASRPTRVALVVRPEQVRPARFVERIARKGRFFLTYFLNPEKATAWVKETLAQRQRRAQTAEERS